jgi:NAD(P)H-dependent FMN reductase
MPVIVGLSGSLRQGSFNTALLRAAAAAMPADLALDIRTIHGIPVFDGDLLAGGLPPAVVALKDVVAASAGLLIATPEYNASVPGALKNAIDWMSRPPTDIGRVFGGKPVALIGATTGRYGTISGQAAWLPVLRTLRTVLWTGGRLTIANAQAVFGPDGSITDEAVAQQVRDFAAGFAAFVRKIGTWPA